MLSCKVQFLLGLQLLCTGAIMEARTDTDNCSATCHDPWGPHAIPRQRCNTEAGVSEMGPRLLHSLRPAHSEISLRTKPSSWGVSKMHIARIWRA